MDKICRPSCATTTCPTGQTCSDTTGTARCACPPNRTGTNCEQCLCGWVLRPSDNTCVQTCAALSCGTHRYCDETSGAPTCVCQAGYTGADCAACAAGYIADGTGQCVRTAPAGTTLLGAGRRDNGEYLLAINTAAGTATPLRPLANLSSQRLTTDFPARTIYTSTATAISRLDPTTGSWPRVAAVQSLGSAAFGGDALYIVGPVSPYLLKRIESDLGRGLGHRRHQPGRAVGQRRPDLGSRVAPCCTRGRPSRPPTAPSSCASIRRPPPPPCWAP